VGVGVAIPTIFSTVPADILQTYSSPSSSSPKPTTLKFIVSISGTC
jgi:hypothetical protein